MAYGTMQSSSNSAESESVKLGWFKGYGRWFTLLAVALLTALNASLCMTFSTVEATSEEVLQTGEKQVANLYSMYLVTVLVGMTPAMYMVDRYEAVMVFLSNAFNLACAWQRWQGITAWNDKYIASSISQLLCGIGAWPIFVLPGQISHRRFPPEEQTLATSLMLQANYFGWLLGSTLPPLVVDDPDSFRALLFGEAVVASVAAVLIVLFYRPATSHGYGQMAEEVESSHQGAESSHGGFSGFMEIFQSFKAHPFFGLQVLSHGLLGGVSFATPSALFFILDDLDMPKRAGIASNFAFIFSGVLAGVMLGWWCQSPRLYKQVLKMCYGFCALALLCCALMVQFGMLYNTPLRFGVLILLVAVAGACSLGFLGIGIEAAALYPVKAAYVCWVVESLVLLFGAVLSSFAAQSSGFWILGGAAVASSLSILFFYGEAPP